MTLRRPLPHLLLILLVMASCAQVVPPSGGPRDTTPPRVDTTFPSTRTTRFSGSKLTIRFADYVDQGVRQAIRIQPATRFATSWSGDELDVTFLEPLRPDATYSVTVGTDFKGANGQAPATAHTILFATGNVIDTGRITGSVTATPAEGIDVFCHPISDSTPNVTRSPAPYRIGVGSNGTFTVDGLADGRYRILAVRDANRNGLADAGEDLGTATADVDVINGNALPVSIVVGTPIDRIRPIFTRARALARRSIELAFSEAIATVDASAITITDSTGNPIRIASAMPQRQASDRVVVRLLDSMDRRQYRAVLDTSAVRDRAGLALADSTRERSFRGSEIADATPSADTTRPDSTRTARPETGSIIATFIDSSGSGGPYLLLLLGKGAVVQSRTVTPGTPFTVDSLPAGELRAQLVLDRNANGRHDTGEAHPWSFAEPVFTLPTIVSVRSRWTLEGIRFVLPASPSSP